MHTDLGIAVWRRLCGLRHARDAYPAAACLSLLGLLPCLPLQVLLIPVGDLVKEAVTVTG